MSDGYPSHEPTGNVPKTLWIDPKTGAVVNQPPVLSTEVKPKPHNP